MTSTIVLGRTTDGLALFLTGEPVSLVIFIFKVNFKLIAC